MAYKRKTRDFWEVQADYGYGDGWEHLCASYVKKEMLTDLKLYRKNAPGPAYRVKKCREKLS